MFHQHNETVCTGYSFPNPSQLKKGDSFVKFRPKHNGVNLTKILQNLKTEEVIAIQEKLLDLKYNLIVNGKIDNNFKAVIFNFNSEECGIESSYITERTVSFLNKLHKKYLRNKRREKRNVKNH
jgi:hypothetical protein